jgi:hypothetical protein
MMKRLSALIAGITTVAALMAAEPLVARVSALSSGSILLNGKQADLKSIDAEFRKLKAARGARSGITAKIHSRNRVPMRWLSLSLW